MTVVWSGGAPVVLDNRVYSMRPSAADNPYGYGITDIGWFGWGDHDDIETIDADPDKIWATQNEIRTVVGFLARNIAQVGMHVYRRAGDGSRDRVRDNALAKVLMAPSAAQTHYDLLYALVVDLCLWDRWAAVLTETPTGWQLDRIPPRTWRYKRNGLGQPTKILKGTPDGLQDVALDAVVWVDGYPLQGRPLDCLVPLLSEEVAARKQRRNLWEKGPQVPAVIERPSAAPPWTTEQREWFRASWARYAGGGDRTGGTPILEDDMKLVEMSSAGSLAGPAIKQQLERQKLTMSEVAAAFGVPPVFVGQLDNANYSNVIGYREFLYADTLGPWFSRLEQVFDARLTPKLGDPGDYCEFNVGAKLRSDLATQADVFARIVGAPVMTRNEARDRLNLARVEDGDALIVPLNLGQPAPEGNESD